MAGEAFGALGSATKEFFTQREDLRRQRESERLAQEQLDNQKAQIDLQRQSQEWNRLSTFNTRLKDQSTWLDANVGNLPPAVVSKYQEMILDGQNSYDGYLQTGDSLPISTWRDKYYGKKDGEEGPFATYMDGTIEKRVRLSELPSMAYEKGKSRKFSEATKDKLGESASALYAQIMTDPNVPESSRTEANETMKKMLDGTVDVATGAARIFSLQGAMTPEKMASQLLLNPTDPVMAKTAQNYFEGMSEDQKYEVGEDGKLDKTRPKSGYAQLEKQLGTANVKQSITNYDDSVAQVGIQTATMRESFTALQDQNARLEDVHVETAIASGNVASLERNRTRLEANGWDFDIVMAQATESKGYIDNAKKFADTLGSDSVQMSTYNLTSTRITTEQMEAIDVAIRPLLVDGAKITALRAIAEDTNGLTVANFAATVLPDMLALGSEADKGDLLSRISSLPGGLGKVLAGGLLQNGTITAEQFSGVTMLSNDMEELRKMGVNVTLQGGQVTLAQGANELIATETLNPFVAALTNVEIQGKLETGYATIAGSKLSTAELTALLPGAANAALAGQVAQKAGYNLQTLDAQSKGLFIEALNEATMKAGITTADLSNMTDTEKMKFVPALIRAFSNRDIAVAGLGEIEAEVGSEVAAEIIRSNSSTLLAQNGLRIKDATSNALFIEASNEAANEAGIAQNKLTKMTAEENAKFVPALIKSLASRNLSENATATTVADAQGTVAASLVLSNAQTLLAENGFKIKDATSSALFVEASNEAARNAGIAVNKLTKMTAEENAKYVQELIASLNKRNLAENTTATIVATTQGKVAEKLILSDAETALARNGLQLEDATTRTAFVGAVNKAMAGQQISEAELAGMSAEGVKKYIDAYNVAAGEAKIATLKYDTTNAVEGRKLLASVILARDTYAVNDMTSKAATVAAVNAATDGRKISEAELATMDAEGMKLFIDKYNAALGTAKISKLTYDAAETEASRLQIAEVIRVRDTLAVTKGKNDTEAEKGKAPFVFNIAKVAGRETLAELKDGETVRNAGRPFLESITTLEGKIKVRGRYADAIIAQGYLASANKIGKAKGEGYLTDLLRGLADDNLAIIVATHKAKTAGDIVDASSDVTKKELTYAGAVLDVQNKYATEIEGYAQQLKRAGIRGDLAQKLGGLPYREAIGALDGKVNLQALINNKRNLETLMPYIGTLNETAAKLKLQGMDNDLADLIAFAPYTGAIGAERGKDTLAKFQLSVAESQALIPFAAKIQETYARVKLATGDNEYARQQALAPYVQGLVQSDAETTIAGNTEKRSTSNLTTETNRGRYQTAYAQGLTQGDATVAINTVTKLEANNRSRAAVVMSEYIDKSTRATAAANIIRDEYTVEGTKELMKTLDYRSLLNNATATIALAGSDPEGVFLKNPEFAAEAKARGMYGLYESTAASAKASNAAKYALELAKLAAKKGSSSSDPRMRSLVSERVTVNAQIDTIRKSANYKNNAAIVAALDKSYITGDAITGYALSTTARTIGTVNASDEQKAAWAAMSAKGKQAVKALQADDTLIAGYQARIAAIQTQQEAINVELNNPNRTTTTNIPGAGGLTTYKSSPLFNSTVSAMGGNTPVVPMQELNNNPPNGFYTVTDGHTGRDYAIGATSPGGQGILNAPIHAFGNLIGGKVIQSGANKGFGNSVKVRTVAGNVVLLAHMSSVGVKVGDKVGANTILGKQGKSGAGWGSSGNPIHVHMQVYDKGGKAVRDVDAFEAAINPTPTGVTSTGFGKPPLMQPTGTATVVAQPSATGKPVPARANPPAIAAPNSLFTKIGKYQMPVTFKGIPVDRSVSIALSGFLPQAVAQKNNMVAAYKKTGNAAKDQQALRKLAGDFDRYLTVELADVVTRFPNQNLTKDGLRLMLLEIIAKNKL